MSNVIEVDPETVKSWIDQGEAQIIDVREDQELASYSLVGALHIPMSMFDVEAVPKDGHKKLVFMCAHGMRSLQVGQYLLDNNHVSEAYNMTGGVAAWAGAGLPSDAT